MTNASFFTSGWGKYGLFETTVGGIIAQGLGAQQHLAFLGTEIDIISNRAFGSIWLLFARVRSTTGFVEI